MPPQALDRLPATAPLAPPATVEEFYIRGEPVRALYADVASLRRRGGGGPLSAAVREHVDAREWCLAGVYLLLWAPDPDRVRVYVGSTGDLLDRLFGHEQTGWASAIALTGHGLTRGRADQFEQGFGKVMLAADPGERLFVQGWKRHPGEDPGDMPAALTRPLIILAERVLRRVGALDITLDPAKAFLP